MNGRTIKLFLTDGIPDGLRTAEIMNWTGKMLVFPRAQLPTITKRPEMRRAGVYFLVGDDPNKPPRERIYIGESEDVLDRLKSHDGNPQKEFWSQTAVVISKDENLTKTHVRYLESKLIDLAHLAGRAELDNSTRPAPISLPESDKADMDFFLAQIQILLPVLGFPYTQQIATSAEPIAVNDPTPSAAPSPALEMTYSGASAEAVEIGGSFIVRANSTAKSTESNSLGKTYQRLRAECRSNGELADTNQPDLWRFTKDVRFNSPSAAAAVIAGSNINGRAAWILKATGQTYNQWKSSKLEEMTPDMTETEIEQDTSSIDSPE
jgi:hypothetical protein